MTLRSAAALTAGCAALGWIVWQAGWPVVVHDVALGGWALPGTAVVFGLQMCLSAQAWRCSLGGAVGRAAIMRMRRALDEFVIVGIETSLPLHRRLLRDPAFVSGNYTIHWLEREFLVG